MINRAPKARHAPPGRFAPKWRPPSPSWLGPALLALVAFLVVWHIYWSLDYPYVRTTRLSSRAEFREEMFAHRSAWSLAGGHGAYFGLPIPSRHDRVQRQTLLVDGKPLLTFRGWAQQSDTGHGPRSVAAFPSPDQRVVALAPRQPVHEVAIVDLATGRVVHVSTPDSLRKHHYDYSFALNYLGWSSDSRGVLLADDYLDEDAQGRAIRARDVWRAATADGRVIHVARCTVLMAETIEAHWEGTPCGGERR